MLSFYRPVYWLGKDTLRVSAALFAENRRRLCQGMKATDGVAPKSVVVLQGGEQKQRYCTDTDMLFRQVHVRIGVPLAGQLPVKMEVAQNSNNHKYYGF